MDGVENRKKSGNGQETSDFSDETESDEPKFRSRRNTVKPKSRKHGRNQGTDDDSEEEFDDGERKRSRRSRKDGDRPFRRDKHHQNGRKIDEGSNDEDDNDENRRHADDDGQKTSDFNKEEEFDKPKFRNRPKAGKPKSSKHGKKNRHQKGRNIDESDEDSEINDDEGQQGSSGDISSTHSNKQTPKSPSAEKRKVKTNPLNVILQIGKHAFVAHSFVLVKKSAIFDQLLRGRDPEKKMTIKLDGISPETMVNLMNFMYEDQLQLDKDNLVELALGAQKLKMEEVLLKCHQWLRENYQDIAVAIKIYSESRKQGLYGPKLRTFTIICNRFSEAAKTEEFARLDFDAIVEILSSKSVGVKNETALFQTALEWLNFDFEGRKQFSTMILHCVRFPLMSVEEILDCYHPQILENVVESPEIRSMLLTATCYIVAKTLGKQHLFKEFSCDEREYLLKNEDPNLRKHSSRLQNRTHGDNLEDPVRKRSRSGSDLRKASVHAAEESRGYRSD